MRSIHQALLWEMAIRGRLAVPICFLLGAIVPAAIYSLIPRSPMNAHDPIWLMLQVITFPCCVFAFSIGVIKALDSASRLYSAPISIQSIVVWHLVPGAILLGSQVAALTWCLNTFWGAHWQILGPVLVAGAAWCTLQPWIHVRQKTVMGTVALAVPFMMLVVWWMTRFGNGIGIKHAWTEVSVYDAMALSTAVIVSYFLAVLVLSHDRSSEPFLASSIWPRISEWLDRRGENAATDLKPFAIPSQAQFWYEWKQKGTALVGAYSVLLVVGALICSVRFLTLHHIFDSIDDMNEVIAVLGGLLVAIAFPAGMFVGMSTSSVHWDLSNAKSARRINVYDMGSFQATRPVTDSGLANAILKTCLLSTLIAWTLWMAIGLLVVAYEWSSNQMPAFFFPERIGPSFVLIVLFGSWAMLTNTTVIGLTGRTGALIAATILSVFVTVYCIGSILLKEFAPTQVYAQTDSFVLTIISIALVAGAITAFVSASRMKLIDVRWIAAAALASLAIGIGASLTAPIQLSLVNVCLIASFAALVVSPIATAPLAIAWNRRR